MNRMARPGLALCRTVPLGAGTVAQMRKQLTNSRRASVAIPPERKGRLAESRFSAEAWLLLMTIGTIASALCVGLGVGPAMRIGLAIAYVAYLVVQLWRPGRKTEAIVSLASAVILNVIVLFRLGAGQHEPSLPVQVAAEGVVIVVFGTWILFAVRAARTLPPANRAIGGLSLLLLVTPGVLRYLDHCQYLTLSLIGVEWWHVRPFDSLAQFLWYS